MSLACPSLIAGIDPTLCQAVDNYCERLGAGLAAEPANALTNLAFLVAGYGAWHLYRARRGPTPDPLVVALIICIPVVGLGSMLFHTVATRWSEWGDVLPILGFMLLYLWLIMRRWLGFSVGVSILGEVVFLEATYVLEARVPTSVLWGGAMYLPTVLVLASLGGLALRVHAGAGRTFLLAVGIFLLSYGARSIDAALCANISIGTHSLWHLLNALMLYLLVKAAVEFRPRRASPIRQLS